MQSSRQRIQRRMFKSVITNLRACWIRLAVCDILFKAITLLLLTPVVSLLFRLFLFASGRTVLADTDIIRFLLHPLGMVAFVVVGGAVLCVFALEQAVLMTICLAADRQQLVPPGTVLRFVAAKAPGLLQLTSRVVAKLGIRAVPFLAVGGAVFWLLLTDHDINFYLTHKPPAFWIACSLIGSVLFLMAALLLKQITGWAFAAQLLLYEGFSPVDAMHESQKRTLGHRVGITKAFLVLAGINAAIGLLLSVLVLQFGQSTVSMASGRLWTLALSVGVVMLLAAVANAVTSVLRNTTCASLLSMLYVRLAAEGEANLPQVVDIVHDGLLQRLTLRRAVIVSAIGVVIAGVIGAAAIHSFDLEDKVQITAHRGGAGVAPENTLAAFHQAIEDGTDWIEIDVQESKDGVVMVAHDSDLAKVARNPVKIWEATAEELRAIDIGIYFGEQFKGERMPTLEEVLQMCKGRVRVNIELKYYGHTQKLENRVIELVERFRMESEIVVMSLESKGIAKVKSLRPDWTVGLLTAVAAGDLTRAKADFLAVNSKLATRGFVQTAHRRNKTVSAWTVNDAYAMSAMISRGVDNLITDYPALARQVLEERQQMSPLERLMVEMAFYLGSKPKTHGVR